MKKLVVVLASLAPTLLLLGADCEGGINTCTVDADCTDTTNSVDEATPFCVDGVCVADAGECTDNLDCQLVNPDSPTTREDDAANCPADEVAVTTTTDQVVCIIDATGIDCAADFDPNTTNVTVDGTDTCLAGGTCEASGACTF